MFFHYWLLAISHWLLVFIISPLILNFRRDFTTLGVLLSPNFVVRAVQIPRSGKISAMGHTFVFPSAGILASGSICAAITTKLVVECPRNTYLKHSRIKRISCNLEGLAISEEVIVKMLILKQYSHSFPLCGDEGVYVWVVTYFDLILVVEYGEGRVISRCVIAGIKSTIQTYLGTQDIALNPKLVVIREECGDKRHRDYGTVRG